MLSEKIIPIPRDTIEKERSFLRWGGLAGIMAGGFLLVTICYANCVRALHYCHARCVSQ